MLSTGVLLGMYKCQVPIFSIKIPFLTSFWNLYLIIKYSIGILYTYQIQTFDKHQNFVNLKK